MSKALEIYEEYVRIYNEIDHYMRKVLNEEKYTEHSYLIDKMADRSSVFGRYAQELRTLAQLRNSLVHNPFMRIAHPIAVPDEKILAQYRVIRDMLLNPPTSLSIAVPVHKLYTATLQTNAIEVMKMMKKHTYTHVPIMEGERMIGVFSENSLLAYIASNEDSIITKDLPISEFDEYIGLSTHPSEQFAFIGRRASLNDVYKIFNDALKKRVRIGVLFVTDQGKSDQKVLGIITAWDLAQAEVTASN